MDKSVECLLDLMGYVTESLQEIAEEEFEHGQNAVLCARKMALVEVMSKLLEWPDAKKYGYDWKVEDEFPV